MTGQEKKAGRQGKGYSAVIREEISRGAVRIQLRPEDADGFEPVAFLEGGEAFLTQAGFRTETRPVYRLKAGGGDGRVKQTANGEVVVFDGEEAEQAGSTHRAVLRFTCPAGAVLTGLGQHEAGIFDYARAEERLYQHNMKISVPFLLSSAGWGLYLQAGCAMRFRGEDGGFTFLLEAADTVTYTVIRGKNCAEVLKRFAELTGKPALLPRWAYGYIQSKERYKTAEELIRTAEEFRRRGLGLDCIVLDWCSWRDGCWGDKNPDPERFPDVPGLIRTLHGMDTRLMVSVWPNVAAGQDFEELRDAGMFLPGSQIYDAFSPAAQDLYWQQCRRHWMDGGADALWCDSCEPITDPDWCGKEKRDEDERMRLLTEASELRMDPERMNDYGAVHVRGLGARWRRDYPEKRPVILARSGGPDSAAWGGILWSGDTSARWDVLEKQVTEGIKAACSGLSWWTLDIGAFFTGSRGPWFCEGDYPEGVEDPAYRELYIRWFQFGSMLPVFRSHGTETPREPWRFGGEDSTEYAVLRDTIALRYRLMPYIYASAAQACRDGLPMLRAMMTAFPEEKELHPLHDQYMLGDALLVKPVVRPLQRGGGETEVALPRGLWYDFFTAERYEGGRKAILPTPLDRFPVLVRAGSILPVVPGAKCAGDVPLLPPEILVYGGADGDFLYYSDAGDGYAAGFTIPLRYRDAEQTLTLGVSGGILPAAGKMAVHFIFPEGGKQETAVRYEGTEVCTGAQGGSPA